MEENVINVNEVNSNLIIEEPTSLVVESLDPSVLKVIAGETVLNLPIEEVTIISIGVQGPPGVDGVGVNDIIVNEVPEGEINGSNVVFYTEFNFIPESVEVILNGLIQRKIFDFNTQGTQTIFLTASPNTGETILVNYLKA